MRSLRRTTENSFTKLMRMASLAAALIIGFCFLGTAETYAQAHTVYVEGNCDSPVPGTTLVAPGTCGDFDGDGRIGTAEDADGPNDRIFGTINAALGNLNLGDANRNASTAQLNGTVLIVASGRFAEQITISNSSSANFFTVGHIQIEAAPGVQAEITAVLQGDPVGGNVARLNGIGLFIDTPLDKKITLRNLTIRGFSEGMRVVGNSRVFVNNCHFENNRNYAIRMQGTSNLTVYESSISATGFRQGGGVSNSAAPGTGIQFEGSATGAIYKTSITGSAFFAVSNQTGIPVSYDELYVFDNANGTFSGPSIRVDF